MTDPGVLRRVAASLRAIHAGPPLASPVRQLSASSRTIARSRSRVASEVPPEYATARQIARTIERVRRPIPERPLSQRSAQREFHRRWLRGSGSSTGSTRGWVMSSSTSPTSRSITGSTRTAVAFLLEAYAGSVRRGGRTRADADVVHVRLPGGDVGRGPAGDLHARVRLRRVHRRALLPPRADRSRSGVRRGPRLIASMSCCAGPAMLVRFVAMV